MHFILGPTGAGKTTHARLLCQKIGGVPFSVDAWMSALFWRDSPQPIEPAWAIERVDRCAALIFETAMRIARAGAPCALEIGLGVRANRVKFKALADAAGLCVSLHQLEAPAEERWRRVERRNRESGGDSRDGGQLDFAITREMFDFTDAMYEPPTLEETRSYHSVRIGPGAF